jgi:hypothetical protein
VDLDGMLPRALVDAEVSMAPGTLALPGGRRLNDWLTATPDEALVVHEGIHILIRGTHEVLVEIDDGADLDLLAPLLYGITVRTLLLHAGVFCLHASVVRHDGTVVAVAGHSGAGKSTTATALARFHGAALLVDDVVPARVVGGRPQVQVFDRPVHLTIEAVERLGVSLDDATSVTAGPRGKVALPATQFGAAPDEATWVDLDRLVVLSLAGDDPTADDGSRADAGALMEHRVSGAERLRWIVRLSNVTGHMTLRDGGTPYFEWASTLADALAMVNIVRPEGEDTLTQVCDAVLATGRP